MQFCQKKNIPLLTPELSNPSIKMAVAITVSFQINTYQVDTCIEDLANIKIGDLESPACIKNQASILRNDLRAY